MPAQKGGCCWTSIIVTLIIWNSTSLESSSWRGTSARKTCWSRSVLSILKIYMLVAISQRSTAADHLFWQSFGGGSLKALKAVQEKPFLCSLNFTCDCSVPTNVYYWQMVRVKTEGALSLTKFSNTWWEDDMTSSRCASTIASSYWLFYWHMKIFIFWYMIFTVKPHMTFYTLLFTNLQDSRYYKVMG